MRLVLRALPIVLTLSSSAAWADGEVRQITKQEVCTIKWGKDARHVSAAMKRRVFIRDGYPLGNKDPRCSCEIDHVVPRSVGGTDTEKNLTVQQYFGPWNAHMKDRLETQAHADVCSGRVSLPEAQSWFLNDWKAAYVARFGPPPSMARSAER